MLLIWNNLPQIFEFTTKNRRNNPYDQILSVCVYKEIRAVKYCTHSHMSICQLPYIIVEVFFVWTRGPRVRTDVYSNVEERSRFCGIWLMCIKSFSLSQINRFRLLRLIPESWMMNNLYQWHEPLSQKSMRFLAITRLWLLFIHILQTRNRKCGRLCWLHLYFLIVEQCIYRHWHSI